MLVLESFSNKLKISTLLHFDVQNTKIIISESEIFFKSSHGNEKVDFGFILKGNPKRKLHFSKKVLHFFKVRTLFILFLVSFQRKYISFSQISRKLHLFLKLAHFSTPFCLQFAHFYPVFKQSVTFIGLSFIKYQIVCVLYYEYQSFKFYISL